MKITSMWILTFQKVTLTHPKERFNAMFMNIRIFTKKKLVFAIILTILFILFNFSITIIHTNTPTTIYFGKDTPNPTFSSSKKTRHFILSRNGEKIIVIKHGDSITNASIKTKPFMFPKNISLDIKQQNLSSKVATNASSCLLYDNPSTNTSIASNCIGNGSQFFKIKNNIPYQVEALYNYNYSSVGLNNNGLVFETSQQTNRGTSYDVRFYNSDSDSINNPVLTFNKSGEFVTDNQTGMVAGYINGNYFYRFQGSGIKQKSKIKTNSNNYELTAFANNTLYVFSGNNPDNFETEGGETLLQEQKVDIYEKDNKTSTIFIDKRFYIYSLSAMNENKLIANTIDTNGKGTILIIDKSTSKITPIRSMNPDQTITAVFPLKENIILLVDGKLWLYNTTTNQYHTMYSSQKIYIKTVSRSNEKLYIITSSPKKGSYGLYSPAYVVDLKHYISIDENRLENILPLSKDDQSLSIDHYRNKILVNGNKPNLLKTAKGILRESGVNIDEYSLVLNDLKYQDTW